MSQHALDNQAPQAKVQHPEAHTHEQQINSQEPQDLPPAQHYASLEPDAGAYLQNGHHIDPHLGSQQQDHGASEDSVINQQLMESVINTVTQQQAQQQAEYNSMTQAQADYNSEKQAQEDAATRAATQAAMAAAQQARHKQTRVAQACDACSQRKVKCDATQPCRNCQDLGVECTRNRERRRRGPPNRVKERLEGDKRMRAEADLDVSTGVANTNGSQSYGMTQSSADLIAPAHVISELLRAFYDYVYPLHPFPHELWLIQSYERRADVGNHTYNPFLALVAAMIGTVATFRPAQTAALVRHVGHGEIGSFIARCRSVCINARGIGYPDRVNQDANDAVTSYFLAIMSAHEKQWAQYQAHISDAVGIVHNQLLFNSPQQRPDEIKRQTAFRVFWATFVLSRSIEHQQPLGSGNVSFPRYPMEPYTRYPSPVSDHAISAEGIVPDQSQSICPPILCLNSLIHLYTAGDVPLAAASSPDFIDTGDLPTLRANIFNAPAAVRQAFDGVDDNVRDLVNTRRGAEDNNTNSSSIAIEIQRTHLMLSSILMRSYLINRALSQVLNSDSDNAEISETESTAISTEREHLARALLFLAKDLTLVGLEPDVWGAIALIKAVIADVCCDEKISGSEVGRQLQTFVKTFDVLEEFDQPNGQDGKERISLKLWQEAFLQSELGGSLVAFA